MNKYTSMVGNVTPLPNWSLQSAKRRTIHQEKVPDHIHRRLLRKRKSQVNTRPHLNTTGPVQPSRDLTTEPHSSSTHAPKAWPFYIQIYRPITRLYHTFRRV